MEYFSIWPKMPQRVQVTYYSRSWWKPTAAKILFAVKYWAEDCIQWLENSGKVLSRETYDLDEAQSMMNEHYRNIVDNINTTPRQQEEGGG